MMFFVCVAMAGNGGLGDSDVFSVSCSGVEFRCSSVRVR